MINEIFHEKLVRDNIPEIIKSNGDGVVTTIVEGKFLILLLIEKIYEEIREFKENHEIEELADICEVLHGLVFHLNFSYDDINSEIDNLKNLTLNEIDSELGRGLEEETLRFIGTYSLKGLAKMFKIVNLIREKLNISIEEFENIRNDKKCKRGGFEKGCYLIKTICK